MFLKNKNIFDFCGYSLASFVCAGVSFLSMIILTNCVSAEFMGKISLFISASNVLMCIVCVGLDSSYIRFFYEPPDNNKKLAFNCIVPSLFITIILGICLLVFSSSPKLEKMFGESGLVVCISVLLSVISLFLVRYLSIFFRMKGKIIWYSIVSIVVVLFTRSIFIIIYHYSTNYKLNIFISSILFVLFVLFLFLIFIKSIVEKDHLFKNKYNEVYKYAILSSPGFIITYLNNYIPLVIIKGYLGATKLGVYTACLLFASAFQVISSGFSTFWSPYMFKNYKDKKNTIITVHSVVLIACIIILFIVLLMENSIFLLLGSDFRSDQNIIGIILIYPITLILNETTAYGISIEKKNEISLIINAISMGINSILCLLLVKRFGLVGAAVSSMISGILQFGLLSLYGQKFYKSIDNKYKTVISFVLLVTVSVLFLLFFDNRLVFYVAGLLAIIIVIIINKDVFKMIKYI